jgi:hypothetical protein
MNSKQMFRETTTIPVGRRAGMRLTVLLMVLALAFIVGTAWLSHQRSVRLFAEDNSMAQRVRAELRDTVRAAYEQGRRDERQQCRGSL